MSRGFEVPIPALGRIEVLAGIEHADQELPGHVARSCVELPDREIRSKRRPVVGQRHLEVGGDRAFLAAHVAVGGEVPTQHRGSEPVKAREPGHGALV